MEQRQQFAVSIGGTTLTNETATTADFSATSASRDSKYRFEDERIATYNLGGELKIAGGVLNFDATTSTAKKEDDPRYNFAYQTGKKDVTGSWNLSNDVFSVTPSASAYDTTKYTAKSVELETDRYNEDLNQFKIDYTIPFEFMGFETNFKTGLKYTDRHKTSEIYYRYYTLSKPTLTNFTSYNPFFIYNNRFAFGPTVDFASSLKYAQDNNLLTSLNASKTIAKDLGGDYDVKEKVSAAYAQATMKNDNLTIIPGIRFEHTESSYAAKQFNALTSSLNTPFNVFATKDYDNVFPSLIGNYRVSKEDIVRFAVSTAIGRPKYSELAPTTSINDNDKTVSVGNPMLKPLLSVNYDAGYEHYFGNTGMFSAQLFYKDISDPIFKTNHNAVNETINGVIYNNYSISQSLNLSSANVYGLELNLIKQFDDLLPAPFDGFGISINTTFQKSQAEGAPNRSGKVSLLGTSDFTGTAEITYEKAAFTSRLAYTYHSEYLDELGSDKMSDIYTAAAGRLDFKAGVAINKNVQAFVQAKNLTNESWHRYQGVKNHLVESEIYGSVYSLGAVVKF